MQTWDAILARRNVRAYLERAITPEDLDRILEAGRRAPSSSNQQRWDFVCVTERARLAELAGVWAYAGHVAASAATVALLAPVAEDPDLRASIAYDLGQATLSMMLAAADLGIGSCHSAVGDEDLARRILGYPSGRRCEYLVSFGYPADRPLTPLRAPRRRPFDEVVHRERW